MMHNKIVFTNGCFDILHVGHVSLLDFCKSLGGKVIVGLNSDASVKMLKGEARPYNTCEDRKKILESLRFVDEVRVFEEETPYEILKEIQPDIIVKGGDYRPEDVVGNDLAKVIIFNYISGKSTSLILDKIKEQP